MRSEALKLLLSTYNAGFNYGLFATSHDSISFELVDYSPEGFVNKLTEQMS